MLEVCYLITPFVNCFAARSSCERARKRSTTMWVIKGLERSSTWIGSRCVAGSLSWIPIMIE